MEIAMYKYCFFLFLDCRRRRRKRVALCLATLTSRAWCRSCRDPPTTCVSRKSTRRQTKTATTLREISSRHPTTLAASHRALAWLPHQASRSGRWTKAPPKPKPSGMTAASHSTHRKATRSAPVIRWMCWTNINGRGAFRRFDVRCANRIIIR